MSETEMLIFDGWRRALGIRQLYSNSRIQLPKWAISKAKYYFGEYTIDRKKNKNYWKDNYDSLYLCILDNVNIIDTLIDKEEILKVRKINKVSNPKLNIRREREITP